MIVTLFGTRGSIPVCSPEFTEFGGNTTCIALECDDCNHRIVVDAGTGIRNLGKTIVSNDRHGALFFCFTHYHWDHIQGLPFFAPAYSQRCHSIFLVPENSGGRNMREILAGQMLPEHFPIPFEKMGGNFYFAQPPRNQHEFMRTMITFEEHDHPGGAYSYRFERRGHSIVIRTDIEYKDGIQEEDVEFCRNADILIHDAQYTDEQLEDRRGWGHSSYGQAIELAERAGVQQLIMTHHDPEHDDAFLRHQEELCQERFANCVLAREGMRASCCSGIEIDVPQGETVCTG